MRNNESDVRDAIISTYLGMIGEYRYDRIPVKKLAARCCIARSTFYDRYGSVLDLLESIESGLLAELALYDRDKIVPVSVKEKTPRPRLLCAVVQQLLEKIGRALCAHQTGRGPVFQRKAPRPPLRRP